MDFPARGAGVNFFRIIWGEFVLASQGDHKGSPLQNPVFRRGDLHGRPRQNSHWFPNRHQT
jgi:hypothetical protein